MNLMDAMRDWLAGQVPRLAAAGWLIVLCAIVAPIVLCVVVAFGANGNLFCLAICAITIGAVGYLLKKITSIADVRSLIRCLIDN